MSTRKYKIIGIVLFLLMLYIVMFSYFIIKDRDFSENENRYLSQLPRLSVDAVLSGQYMQDIEQYIDDQFPKRDTWVTLKSDFSQLIGNREVNGVYLGDDKYLIEKWLPEDVDQELLKENIETLNSFAKNHPEQKMSLMIVPTAGLVLKDKLPDHAPMFDQNIAFKTIEDNITFNHFIDVRQVLMDHSEEYIYYKTDHHWTSYGAYLAYSEWCRMNGTETQQDDYEIESVSSSFRGSLFSKVLSSNCAEDRIELYNRKNQPEYTVSYNFGRTESDSVYALENLEKKDKYLVFLNGNHPEVTIRTSQSNNKHLLVFKDSFANSFIPFLLEDYETIHIIDLRYYNGDIDEYMAENSINECLVLYNIKNFCEDKGISKIGG